jgi:cytoskeletal protein CcmA (bactofilin family)
MLYGNIHTRCSLTTVGDVNVGKNVTVSDSLSVYGDINSGTSINSAGDANIGGNLTVANSIILYGNENIHGSLTVHGVTKFNKSIVVSGTSLFDTLTVLGETTLDRSVTIRGVTNLKSDLNVIGNATIGGILNGLTDVQSYKGTPNPTLNRVNIYTGIGGTITLPILVSTSNGETLTIINNSTSPLLAIGSPKTPLPISSSLQLITCSGNYHVLSYSTY